MARPLRIEYPDAYYHVTSRGNERKDISKPRKTASNLCHQYTGKRLKEIGEYFKVTESGVSQTSHRVAVELEKDKKLSVMVERIKQKLNLSKV